MKFLVHLRWKVLLQLDERFDAGAADSRFFKRLSGKGFARSLGGDFQLEKTPVVLSPTDLFHEAISATRIELGVKGHRFPYDFDSEELQQHITANFTLQCHARFLCVTIRLNELQIQETGDWAALQDLREHRVLWQLTRKVLALALTGYRNATLNQEPQVFPALHIHALDQDLPDWESRLACLVTRHANLNADIVNKVVEKNRPHRLDRTLLLLDKQGIASYVPTGTVSSAVRANLDRFENSIAMLQLAAVLRLKMRSGTALGEDELLAILNPNAAITASVSGRHIWSLFVLEFSLEIWLKKEAKEVIADTQKPLAFALTSCDAELQKPELFRILVITVTTLETRALRNALSNVTGREPTLRKIATYSYQDFGKLGEYEVWHQISGMGSGGLDGSQESVGRSIQAVKPAAVLMVGIAFGIDPVKQPIGTILVSKQIQMYEMQRVNKEASLVLRGDRVTSSPMLLNWVSHAEVDWPQTNPSIQRGLVLSGEKLVDNKDFRDQLVELAPETLGGEMEGAGVYVASQSAKVDWLLVKAVCDWADGNKATNKNEQQFKAASFAADFLVQILRSNSEVFP